MPWRWIFNSYIQAVQNAVIADSGAYKKMEKILNPVDISNGVERVAVALENQLDVAQVKDFVVSLTLLIAVL